MTVRLDDRALAEVGDVLRAQVDDGILPSCSAAIAMAGEVVWADCAGPVTTSTRYVIFSASKALVAATVWQLLDEGRLRVDQPVRDVIGSFGTDGSTPDDMGAVTVEQLLTHTSGFPTAHLAVADWRASARRQAAFARWHCTAPPGAEFTYHPVSAHWVLAELIEIVDGRDFRVSVHDRVTRPLGLPQALGAPDALGPDVRQPVGVNDPATDEEWAAVGLQPPEFPDAQQPVDIVELLCQPVVREVGVPAGGGVMTPSELALFYQGVLHNTGGLWSEAVLERGTSRPYPNLVEPTTGFPANRSLGLIVAGDDGTAGFRGFGLRVPSPRAFGHDGAGGQIAFADPDRGLSIAFLTDGMDLHAIRQWKRCRAFADAALSCLA